MTSPYTWSAAWRQTDWWQANAGKLLVVALLVVLAVRAVLAGQLGLTDDEAYYRLWALAPAASYLDHPPMVGWWIAAGRAIGGDTAFGVRLMQLLAFLIGSAALWRANYLLFGRRVGVTALLFSLVMPLMAAGGIVITPDGPTVLAWALMLWALAELLRSRNAYWWLAVGAIAGLGLLSKYTNLFLGAGIVAWLALVPELRRQFLTWQLWAGGAIAVVCALPVLYWNAQHDWASFAKQFGRVARGSEITVRYLGEMIGAFAALASPVIAVLAVGGFAVLVRRAVRMREPAAMLIVALATPLLLYFCVHALHARVQANWLAPLYPLAAIAAALAMEQVVKARWRGVAIVSAVGVGFVMTALLYAHAVHPLDGGALRKDPTQQMRGWADLAQQVERVRAEHGAAWITTSSYATTGQLAFASKAGAPVIQLDERIRYVHLPPPDADLLRKPALYVELQRREDVALLSQRFAEVQRLADLTRTFEGRPLETYSVFLVSGAHGDVLSQR